MKMLYKKRKTQNEKRKTKNFVSCFLVSLFLCFIVAFPAFAQQADLAGLNAFERAGSGLATTDIRVTIGNIIRAFLGLLGTVAIVLVLYAGFLWMTAAGNEEQIAKAKKILTNAVIGLVLILAAFAIVSFIISRILAATGLGEGVPGAGVGPPGGVGQLTRANSFTVESVQPNGDVGIRNIVVRLNFTRDVDAATVTKERITVTKEEGQSIVEGDLVVKGQVVEFTPKDFCFPTESTTKTQKCFEPGKKYLVEAKTGIKSTIAEGEKPLQCGSGFSRTNTCKDTFTSGTEIDDDKPIISINLPTAVDGFVPANAEVPIDFTAKDKFGVSYVAITDGDDKVTTMMPGAGIKSTNEYPWQGSSRNPWSTVGKTPGPTEYTITGQAFDIDSNIGEVSTKVKIRAAHCFDKIWNIDLVPPLVNETGIDCGGSDCGACKVENGGSCTSSEQCVSGACAGGKCVAYPTITNVAPLDGKAGTLVTITGQGFGTTRGDVHFYDGKLAEQVPSNCSASAVWRDDRIIVAVPNELTVAGPIKVTNNANKFWDDTANERGNKFTFTPSKVSRPGLCGITPAEDEPGKPVVVQGVGLNAEGWSLKIGGAIPGGTPTASADGKSITGATVPDLSPANVDVTMVKGTASSNPVSFTVKPITGKPRIDTIDPLQGPPGTYVTLKGANFGTSGVVHFVSQKDPMKKGEGTIDFPSTCAGNFWTPESVTVKVPNVPVDLYDLSLAVGALESDSVPFKVQAGTPPPGICRLDPDNGPVGLTVEVSGDRFGATKGKVVFYNEKTGIITSWSDQSVMSQVPVGAAKGPVRVGVPSGTGALATFTDSNSLLFTVQDCRSGTQCGSGEQCCGDGSCRQQGTCAEAAAACTFSWKFTTGVTPGDSGDGAGGAGAGVCAPGLQLLDGVCQDTMPHVIEDVLCAIDSQSPSPYKDTKDACKEAQIAARFTMDMHDAMLTATDGNDNIKNVILTECNTGGSLVPSACTTPIGLTWSKWLAHDMVGEGAIYKPRTTPLKAATWYRVTLKGSPGGIAGKDGTLLDGDRNAEPGGDYAWTFLTRGANDTCSVEKVLVSPGAATITAPNATQDFSGLLVGPKCNLLDDAGYTWQWTVTDNGQATTKATVAPATPGGKTTARSGSNATAETVNASGVDTPIDITARAGKTATDTKSDAGKLTIRFAAPTVVAKWPTCGTACSNAEIGVQFSLPVLYKSPSGSVDAVKLYACQPVSGDIATLKTTVETQGAVTQADGTAAVTRGDAAKAVGDVENPPIPTKQVEAASTAAEAARKAATSASALADAVTRLMDALGDKATADQRTKADAVSTKAGDAETQAAAAEKASSEFSAVRAGDAAIAAGNAAKDAATSAAAIASATTATVTECSTAEKLVQPAIPIRAYTYNPTTHILRFYPQGGLLADTAYRVTVASGGTNGIIGVNTKALEIGTNTFTDNDNKQYYSWKFRTKKAPATCAIDRADVEPKSYTSYVTGETTPYSSVAFGAPDACNPAEGQRLDPLFYNWDWRSSKESVGRLLSPLLNLLPAPPLGPDNNIDPEQQVISVGVEQGKTEDVTDVLAGALGKEGKGSLKVVCGFTSDTQCNAFSLLNDSGARVSCTPSQTLPDKCGVANNTCCGIRPTIVAFNPPALVSTLAQLQSRDTTKDVCPNAALSITFDQPMDIATLSGNVRLSKKAGLKQGSTTEYNFTAVPGSADGAIIDGKTVMTFFPKTKLDVSTTALPAIYRLEVNGDAFGAVPQSETDKIRNAYGVALAGVRSYFFQTKSTLCTIDQARIQVIPPQTVAHLDRFTCGRDDCPDDQGKQEKGNQHVYKAEAYDRSGQLLTIGSVVWSKQDDDAAITLSDTTGERITATSTVKNGEAEVTAEVSGRTPEEGRAQRTLRVLAFMCENPWPSLATFPWRDPDTHVELFYCRDAGNLGRADDLPELKTPIAVPRAPGDPTFVKDFLLPVNE